MEIQSFRGMHSEIDKFNLSPDQSPDCSCVRLDPIGDLSKNNAGYRKFLLSSLYDSGNSGLTIHSHKTGGYYQHFMVDDGDSGRVVSIGDLVKSKVKQEDFLPGRDEEWEEVEDLIEGFVLSLTTFDNYLYAGTGTNGKIYRTLDGDTWAETGDLGETVSVMAEFDNYLYAGTGAGTTAKIYRSSDGVTWALVETLTGMES